MGEDGNAERKRARRSRWAPVNEAEAEVTTLKARLDNITRTISTNTIPVDDLCRSPSPEPRYDAKGKRVNTRPDRARDKLELERHKICVRLRELDPNFTPPTGMRPIKLSEKLYIPKEKEGTINFIGLILGPRGSTQKALEREFNCRVAIRGKGSVKDGRARGPPTKEDEDKLHVVISAEGIDAKNRIERCKVKIKDILTPRADDENAHKQKQLRELARMNGTLREQDCEPGAFSLRPGGATVSASGPGGRPGSLLGGSSTAGAGGGGGQTSELDAEYMSFMAELQGGMGSGQDRKQAPVPHARPDESQYRGDRKPLHPWLLPGAFATRPPEPPPEYVMTSSRQTGRPTNTAEAT